MTELARTLASLSQPARAAVFTYTWVALEHDGNPAFGPEAQVGTFVEALLIAGGTWADVLAVIALHEPALDFLNPWHARTAWVSRGGRISPVDFPASKEGAVA